MVGGHIFTLIKNLALAHALHVTVYTLKSVILLINNLNVIRMNYCVNVLIFYNHGCETMPASYNCVNIDDALCTQDYCVTV